MTQYEKLLEEAVESKLTVIENYDLSDTQIKGLYCDGTIALSNKLQTNAEKISILAEELGHYYTTMGNILDQTDISNRKQELRARLWAYNKMIGLHGIINAYKNHCRNRYEIAEYLNVTESFLCEALNLYMVKYGICATLDNYVIYFEPLSVLELL